MAKRPKDHYEALGISRNAKNDEIRRAYRDKVKKHHPDASGGGDSVAFRAAQEAYETLRDPGSREAYDLELRRRESAQSQRSSRPRQGGQRRREWSDPFSTPFGTDTGRPAPGASGRSRGMDDLFEAEDDLFAGILRELFGGDPGAGRQKRPGNAFGGFGDMFSEPGEGDPFSGSFGGGRREHRHLRDEEPLSVVVHLSPDEAYTGATVTVDLGAGRSLLATVPPGVRNGDIVRTEFADRGGPRELKLRVRIQ